MHPEYFSPGNFKSMFACFGANHSSFNKKRGDFEQKIVISSNMKMKPLLANHEVFVH